MKKQIEVVAAIILRENKILVTQRGYGDFKGLWEFPGGKIEAGETREEALKREIKEELDIPVQIDSFLKTITYEYPNFILTMHCFVCSIANNVIHLNEHMSAKYITTDEIDTVDFLPADKLVLDDLKSYLKGLN